MFREKAILKVAKEVSDGVIVANNMNASVVAKGNVTIKANSGDATDVLSALGLQSWPSGDILQGCVLDRVMASLHAQFEATAQYGTYVV